MDPINRFPYLERFMKSNTTSLQPSFDYIHLLRIGQKANFRTLE